VRAEVLAQVAKQLPATLQLLNCLGSMASRWRTCPTAFPHFLEELYM